MNNKNKILVVSLALLLVLSVGYALFSENITINGTATAKGSFDIVGTCQTGIPDELRSQVDDELIEGGYKNDSCSINGNEGTFAVEFEYPGALRIFTFKFTNNGTIPAMVGDAKGTNLKICIGADLCVEGVPDELKPSIHGNGGSIDLSNVLKMMSNNPAIVGIQIGNGAIIPYDDITAAQGAEFMDSNGNYILKPGNSVFYSIGANFSSQAGSDNGGSFELLNEITYEFPFTQVTE